MNARRLIRSSHRIGLEELPYSSPNRRDEDVSIYGNEVLRADAIRGSVRQRPEDLTFRLIEAEKEAAVAPVLRESVEALRQALDSERQHKAELRRELERLSRPWWRLAG
ncbi:MAG: hypothetical protein M3O00_09825 [Pseudomonadota bacterium]|nr:hypothetical protein [Pseudomonadota bacterium]